MAVCTQSVEQLHRGILEGEEPEILERYLWDAVLAYQNYRFHTLSGLEFSYTVKRKKNGEYSGELLVSRKETSKTLTRSSVLLAFHKVLDQIEIVKDGDQSKFIPPKYRGPKAIGQIFGISYIFSLFLEFGLIRKTERQKGQSKSCGMQSC